MSTAWGGHGGGGGFGGFPYRGAHQQGSDGSQRQRRGGGRRRRQRTNNKRGKQQQAATLLCAADLFVPEHCRGRLIGRSGTTIRQLTTECNVKIHVPTCTRKRGDRQHQQQQQQHQHQQQQQQNHRSGSETPAEEGDRRPVRIKAESIASLLHASWRILALVSAAIRTSETTTTTPSATATTATTCTAIQCRIRIPDNTPSQKGYLQQQAPFFVQEDSAANGNNNHRLVAYCVESFLDADEVETLVDNERFADATITAQFETVYQDSSAVRSEGQPATLIFVYGAPQLQKPHQLALALENATLRLWREYNDSIVEQALHHRPAAPLDEDSLKKTTTTTRTTEATPIAITVGTYNLLYPVYAQRYQTQQGLNRLGFSNWEFRAPAIARILIQSNLDLYLLQEITPNFLSNIQKLSEMYHIVQYTHPSPSEPLDMIRAGDAVAILIRKERFIIHKQEIVPFRLLVDSSKSYMCAATALVEDIQTKLRYWIASTHFYTKKALNPQENLLQILQEHQSECDAVVWGGDCNDEYNKGTCVPDGYRTIGTLQDNNIVRPKRLQKKIDWIFFSEHLTGMRTERTEAFIQATSECLEPTGCAPSDHIGEAFEIKNYAE